MRKVEDIDFSKRYTYADYLTWQFDEMVELIRGKVYRMTPAPNLSHQEVSSNLLRQIFSLMGNKSVRSFMHLSMCVCLSPNIKLKTKK